MSENTYAIVKFIPGGVYRLLSPSGKSYIGQAKDTEERHYRYKFNHCEHQPKLRNALKKYGWNNMKVKILVRSDDLSIRHFWEKWFIMKFDSMRNGYNCTLGGEGSVGFKHSKQSKLKMSIAQSGENHPLWGTHRSDIIKEKISSSNKGKIISKKTRKKLAKSRKERFSGVNHPLYGKHHSKESKLKMSNSHIGIHDGKNNPMFGKHRSAETKKKLALANFGKHPSKETREKMSIAQKNRQKLKREINEKQTASNVSCTHNENL